jgi:hypothetical protein
LFLDALASTSTPLADGTRRTTTQLAWPSRFSTTHSLFPVLHTVQYNILFHLCLFRVRSTLHTGSECDAGACLTVHACLRRLFWDRDRGKGLVYVIPRSLLTRTPEIRIHNNNHHRSPRMCFQWPATPLVITTLCSLEHLRP